MRAKSGRAPRACPLDHGAQAARIDRKNQRVSKACQRCRMKKTKCDSEFPCKRCQDEGLICTTGVRKKVVYKRVPSGYAEVLENTQLTLIATIRRLYSMVRATQRWEPGEPELNDRGEPVIHNIALKLGCIYPNRGIGLPLHSLSRDEQMGTAELAIQLEDKHKHDIYLQDDDSSPNTNPSRVSWAELDRSSLKGKYSRALSGSMLVPSSPQSMITNDFDGVHGFVVLSNLHVVYELPTCVPQPRPETSDPATNLFQQSGASPNMDMFSQVLNDKVGVIEPHIMACPNPMVMMGMEDPMLYTEIDSEPM